MRFKIKAEALADLEEIYAYSLAEHDLDHAETYLAKLREQFDRLIEFPRLAPVASGLKQPLRVWKYGRHHIYYAEGKETLTIVRILHHARDAAHQFRTSVPGT